MRELNIEEVVGSIMNVVGRCKGLKRIVLVGLFLGEILNFEHD